MSKDIEYLKKYYKGDINDAIKRLNMGEPVQYIVGDVDFYGNIIKVNKNVLIPRRETEELVEKVLKRTQVFDNPVIADIGTGRIEFTLSDGASASSIITVIENAGRYTGNSAKWKVEVSVSLIERR